MSDDIETLFTAIDAYGATPRRFRGIGSPAREKVLAAIREWAFFDVATFDAIMDDIGIAETNEEAALGRAYLQALNLPQGVTQ